MILEVIVLCLIYFTKMITCPVEIMKGVSMQRLSLFEVRKNFTCLDGSQTFPFSHVNDDYCDCNDGTDEPGTSGCPNGIFHCRNGEYLPEDIPSSRVNDGICDCCDGSDEYNGAHCLNTCEQLRLLAKKELDEKNELLKKGNILRMEMVTLGKEILKNKHQRLVQLENDKVKAKALIKKWEDTEKRIDTPNILKSDLEINGEPYLKKKEETSTERFDSRSFQDNAETKSSLKPSSPILPMNNEAIEFSFRESQEDLPVIHPKSEFENYSIHSSLSADDEEDSVDIPNGYINIESDPQKLHYLEAHRSMQAIKQEIAQLERFLSIDYGLDNEFVPLYGQCFTYSVGHYTYELCPFINVTQEDNSVASVIQLGSWAGWVDEKHSVMLYDKGQFCTNGLERTTLVYIYCGLINEVIRVKEPTKCEYVVDYRTPCACKFNDYLHDEL